MDKKLFAVYLGGRADRCNIELHDVVFVVGSTIEQTYSALTKKWFGNLQRLHMDSYIQVEYMDGYKIELSEKRPASDLPKLYFVNLGAYKKGDFIEHHQSAFYVATSSVEVMKKAQRDLCQGMEMVHKDDLFAVEQVEEDSLEYDVDDIVEIEEVDQYYISLVPAPTIKNSIPFSAYIKLK